LFPALVFVVGLLISFTTGTSWGTMGILMPLAIPVAVGMNPAEGNLVSAVVAAVFSGAVFGDHCSPFSDTTIVSSLSCDLEPTRHVVTQLPYALIAAGLALLVGFLPAGFGVPGILCLAVGGIVIICLPRIWPGASSAAGKSASN
jgi:Na+/H+ antiporter NhaC